MEASPPPGQQAAYDAASRACQKEFEKYNPIHELTANDYKLLYRQELEAVQCLQRLGLPTGREPISEQQYVSDYAAGRQPSWSAFESLNGKDLDRALANCPQPDVRR